MTVRTLVLLPLAALVLAPVPALARERGDGAKLQQKLEDPRTQVAVADALGGLFSVLLGMKAEPLAKAMDATGDHDGARRIPKGATIGDLVGPEGRTVPRQIKKQVPGMMTAMGSMVGALDEMVPQLEAVGKQLERDLGDLD